jgi:hypothetical protein
MSVNEVLEAVKGLSPEEREQVRALLDTLHKTPPASPEEVAQAELREAGLLAEIKRPRVSARARHTPVEIKGKPLSETVIEERG